MYRFAAFFYLLATVFGGSIPRGSRIVKPIFPNGRIVGGVDIQVSEVPYQVALEWDGYQFCAASIISNIYLLSASHCVEGWDAHELSIRTGSSQRENGGTVIKVQQIISNPLYNSSNVDYDVSIIRLQSPIEFDVNSQPIPLTQVEPSPGVNVIVSGWGTVKEGGESSSTLKLVQVPIIDKTECNQAYSRFGGITERMMCAGDAGHDSCQGDSGGPVAFNGKIIGIISWGFGCARQGYPGVYTNIMNPEIRQFIRNNTGL